MRIQGIDPKLNSFIYTLASKREKSTTPNKRGRKWVYAQDTQSHENLGHNYWPQRAKIVEVEAEKTEK